MKKVLAIIIVVIILISCVSCDSNTKAPPIGSENNPDGVRASDENRNSNNNLTSSEPSKTPEPSPIPPRVIAEFQTKIYDKIKNRTDNLNISANYINGTIVKSGEIFSFNDTVGVRSTEKGYKDAITFDEKGNPEYLPGGGICQISTTIYKTAKVADFEIIERHDHKDTVPYAKKGEDAAVLYGKQDFKFKNTGNADIKIEVAVNQMESVIVRFWSI